MLFLHRVSMYRTDFISDILYQVDTDFILIGDLGFL